MRKVVAIVVGIIVIASCVPWFRQRHFFPIGVGAAVVVLFCFLIFSAAKAIEAFVTRKEEETERKQYAPSPRVRRIVLGGIFVLVLMFTVPHYVATSNGAYILAVDTANRSAQFSGLLGAPVREAWFSEGTTEFGDDAKAVLEIPVRGQSRSGDLRVNARKEAGQWKLNSLVLYVHDSGQSIDLLPKSNPHQSN